MASLLTSAAVSTRISEPDCPLGVQESHRYSAIPLTRPSTARQQAAETKPTPAGKFAPLLAGRVKAAKRAYVTRNMDLRQAKHLKRGKVSPKAGDLLLARIVSLGQHKRIENTHGRRVFLHPGDEIILSYGARYAADQFEGYVPEDLADCYMVAAGGIAATYKSKNAKVKNPTLIHPIGLLCDRDREVINLKRAALTPPIPGRQKVRPQVIAVVGSGMNAGKTTVASTMIHALSRENLRTVALKVTGTGAGGDMWQYQDAGAIAAYDFTDAGYPSTFKVAPSELRSIMATLMAAALAQNPDIIIVEIADGLLQEETNYMIRADWFKEQIDCLVYAARDGLSASAGVKLLQEQNMPLIALGGMLTASPLCAQEAAIATQIPIFDATSYNDTATLAHTLLRNPRQS